MPWKASRPPPCVSKDDGLGRKHCSPASSTTTKHSSREDAKQAKRLAAQLCIIRQVIDNTLQALPKAGALELVGDRLLVGPFCVESSCPSLSLALRDEVSCALDPTAFERTDDAISLASLLINELVDELADLESTHTPYKE